MRHAGVARVIAFPRKDVSYTEAFYEALEEFDVGIF